MRIILAAPRGFCAGVNMAIESLELAIESYGTPVYVYHQIVHNRWVVERFQQRGVVFVDDLGAVPDGACLLYSAHGVPPTVRTQAQRRGLRIIDATCPLVTKVHTEAIRLAKAGYTTVLIGHAGHDEVMATMGEAPEAIVLVESTEDVGRLQVATPEKLAYLTQTTLSVDDAARIIGRLRERFPDIVGPRHEDICYATQNRQQAVRRLSAEADLALVIGSQNSSNSQRLAELARASGIGAQLIDGPADIDPDWLAGCEVVLITAGASAPEDIVRQCVDLLRDRFGATVQTRTICEEDVRFALPKQLRD